MQREERKKLHFEFIKEKVNPILERMIIEILIQKPQDVVMNENKFILEFDEFFKINVVFFSLIFSTTL